MNVRRPSLSFPEPKPQQPTPPEVLPPEAEAPLTGLAWALDDFHKHVVARKARHEAQRKMLFVPSCIFVVLFLVAFPFIADPHLATNLVAYCQKVLGQDRKRQWVAVGIKSELGRGASNPGAFSLKIAGRLFKQAGRQRSNPAANRSAAPLKIAATTRSANQPGKQRAHAGGQTRRSGSGRITPNLERPGIRSSGLVRHFYENTETENN